VRGVVRPGSRSARGGRQAVPRGRGDFSRPRGRAGYFAKVSRMTSRARGQGETYPAASVRFSNGALPFATSGLPPSAPIVRNRQQLTGAPPPDPANPCRPVCCLKSTSAALSGLPSLGGKGGYETKPDPWIGGCDRGWSIAGAGHGDGGIGQYRPARRSGR